PTARGCSERSGRRLCRSIQEARWTRVRGDLPRPVGRRAAAPSIALLVLFELHSVWQRVRVQYLEHDATIAQQLLVVPLLGLGLGLAVALRDQVRALELEVREQVVADRLGARLAQPHVVQRRAARVGVTLHLDPEIGELLERLAGLVQRRLGL